MTPVKRLSAALCIVDMSQRAMLAVGQWTAYDKSRNGCFCDVTAGLMLPGKFTCPEGSDHPNAVLRSERAVLCTQVHVFKVPVRQNPSSQFRVEV